MAYDDNGHGTHVAGCIASDGPVYRGVAPGANIIGVKVLNKLGSGVLSTVIEGVQWCIDNKDKLAIKVINMSLGSAARENYKEDPVCHAVEKAWKSGIVVCVAAGNEGPDPRTISSPGIHPDIITVGAADDKNSENFSDYEVAEFSSRGPTIDGLSKPDVVCPGTDIISLRSPGSLIDKQNKSARVGSEYIALSGTSMATPICAGIAALVLESDAALSPDDVKTILKQTARPLPGAADENIQGKGMAIARSAVNKALSMFQKESRPTSSKG
jgi:serine protease AprX